MPACIAKGNINTSRVFKPWIQSGPLWIKRSSFSREICHRNRNVNWLTRRRWCGWCYIINDMRATGITTEGNCSLTGFSGWLKLTSITFTTLCCLRSLWCTCTPSLFSLICFTKCFCPFCPFSVEFTNYHVKCSLSLITFKSKVNMVIH